MYKKIKFDKYHIKLNRQEFNFLVPRHIDKLDWAEFDNPEYGNMFAGDREALKDLKYCAALLALHPYNLIYLPIKNHNIFDDFNYEYDALITTTKTNFHTSDWKLFREKIKKSKPDTYSFSFDKEIIDKEYDNIFENESVLSDYYRKMKDNNTYSKIVCNTLIEAFMPETYLNIYYHLDKFLHRYLENEYIKGSYPEYGPYGIYGKDFIQEGYREKEQSKTPISFNYYYYDKKVDNKRERILDTRRKLKEISL